MTLSVRQFQKQYNKYLLELLKDGKLPTFDEVVARARNRLPDTSTTLASIYTYVPQTAKSVFDINLYNQAVDDIHQDISLLNEELTSIEVSNIQRMLHAELFHSVHSYELGRLTKQLDALLFALEGADDNFFASYESFDDLSKTDLDLSTPGIIQLDEGSAALPNSTKGTFKTDISHLYNLTQANVTISPSTSVIIGSIPGTMFGNIFRDSSYSWGIQVQSPVNQRHELSFVFSLKEETWVNKITLVHFGSKPQTVYIYTSVDNINFRPIVEYSSGVVLSAQNKVVSLDIEDILVEYVRVVLAKDEADGTVTVNDSEMYQYIFGLKNISLFSTGRASTGTYISKPFDFSEDLSVIGKIAISADEKIPSNTSINWSVAVVDSEGDVGNFIPIVPQSRASADVQSSVINVQDALLKTKFFTSDPDTYINQFTYNSVPFYSLASIDTEPVFGTAKLYRGYNSWLRDSQGVFEVTNVKDNFIPFSKGNAQYLYTVINEVATVQTVATDPSKRVILLAKTPLYFDNGSFSLIPNTSIDIDQDTAPNYAIFNVTLTSGYGTSEVVATFTANEFNIGYPNVIYSSIEVKEYRASGEVERVFVEGRDYIVDLDDSSYPTGRIILTESSPLVTPATGTNVYKIRYTTDADVTRFVSSINGQQVFLTVNTTAANVITGYSVLVKYRAIATDVIKSSIRVKSLYGNSGTVYTQGIDFIFDSNSSLIYRLTTGGIQSQKDVYVDFKYNDNVSQLHQFFVWAFVSSPQGTVVKLSTQPSYLSGANTYLIPNTEAGEILQANIPGIGLVNITNATEWPAMRGWVQFIVKSLPPENFNTANRMALIDQVLMLKDRLDDYIFIPNGKYFAELTAIREPLRQVSLPFLKANVLKNDNSYFAMMESIDSGNVVYFPVVNFEPNETTTLYQYSVDPVTDSLRNNNEEWKLEWSTRVNDNPVTSIVVKAELRRDSVTNGNVTPKIYSYYVKVSY